VERLEEGGLIERVLAGDLGAARRLYDANFADVYRLVYRFAGERDLAQDWAQDTFIRVFKYLPTFRRDGPIAPWIRRIATSVALTGVESRKRLRARETDIEAATTVAAKIRESPPDLRERMAAAIESLPEKYRIVFTMYDVQGYTHPEIAEVLGVPVGTTKAQLARARAKLRESLAEFEGDWADE
jgi:RNA polymerase sigma-70 factor, ECF subfamily